MSPSPPLPGMPEEAAARLRPLVGPQAQRIARAVLERLDLSAFYRQIRAAVDGPGRPASDPRVLLGLWLLATVEGIGSARRLARLSEEHDAYRWLRGGVPVNSHLLADFRVAHQAELDALLTQTIALLLSAELVTPRRVGPEGEGGLGVARGG